MERLEDRCLLTCTSGSINNVLVNNPAADMVKTRDTQAETGLVAFLNGTDVTVIVGYNDTGSIKDNPNPINQNHATGWARSTNCGETFTDQATLPDYVNGDFTDPVLARDSSGGQFNGRIYLGVVGFNTKTIPVFRSIDNGASFTDGQNPPQALVANAATDFTEDVKLDKPWLAVDTFSGTGAGNVYATFANVQEVLGGAITRGIYFTRSTDGAVTWARSTPFRLAQATATVSVFNPWVVVGTNHHVYVFWVQSTKNADSTVTTTIRFRKSTDEGQNFGTESTILTLTNNKGGNGDLILGAFRTFFPFQVAVNKFNGYLYLAYHDWPDTVPTDRGNIYLAYSPDGGTSWNSGGTVNNNTGGANDDFFPTLAVTPNGGKLGVFWYTRRRDPNNHWIDRNGAIYTLLGGIPINPTRFRLSSAQFPVVTNVDESAVRNYIGDHDQVVADNDYFYTTWTDGRNASTLHSGRNLDVRFSRIPVAAEDSPPTIVSSQPKTSVTTPDNPFLSPLRIGFDEPIQTSTFATADIRSFVDTGGTSLLPYITGVTAVAGTGNQVFDISWNLPAGTLLRGYSMQIGPDIQDTTNKSLDQNVNFTGGEDPGDRYTATYGTDTPGSVDQSTSNNTWYLANWNGSGSTTIGPFGYGLNPWKLVGGDWNGDALDTIGVFEPIGPPNWYLANQNVNGTSSIGPFTYGDYPWTPIAGDWDGDGVVTIGMVAPGPVSGAPTQRPNEPTWFLRNINSAGITNIIIFQFGFTGWKPVVGDWNGDGIDTIGMVEPTGTLNRWYLKDSNSEGVVSYTTFTYGGNGWPAFGGDWDGDGKDSMGVIEATGGQSKWYLRNTIGEGVGNYIFDYGLDVWKGVVGNWDGPPRATGGPA